eukprot:2818639-Pyramimonas_sp.AAC.1
MPRSTKPTPATAGSTPTSHLEPTSVFADFRCPFHSHMTEPTPTVVNVYYALPDGDCVCHVSRQAVRCPSG